MQLMKKHIVIMATSLLFMACSASEVIEPETPATPLIAVNIANAEEADETTGGEYDYRLLFWTGANTSVSSSLFYTFESGVFGQHQLKYSDGSLVHYPENNYPVYTVGYLPKDSLVTTDNYASLDLATKRPAGLTDVCSTLVMEGKETSPFDDGENKIEFAHTLVKLDFVAERTENVKARIWNVEATIPGSWLRDAWVYTPSEGFVAATNSNPELKDLIFTSGEHYFDIVENSEAEAASRASDKAIRKAFTRKGGDEGCCYVSHTVFGYDAVAQQAIVVLPKLTASISRSDATTATMIEENITIPLTDENGVAWNKEVKPGDAFTIHIVFDQNIIRIWAVKQPWKYGGTLFIPLNPKG